VDSSDGAESWDLYASMFGGIPKKEIDAFAASFKDFDRLLRKEILTNMLTVNITNEESTLCEAVFKRLASIPLIDKYEAYQILDNEWNKISVDLEIIQTEGFEATKKVDPMMVIKKKDGKDVEVQDGWIGRVLPFELVQQTLLKEEYQELKDKETRLSEISAECEVTPDGDIKIDTVLLDEKPAG